MFSPSDVAAIAAGEEVTVGGRVVDVDHGRIRLADAFAAIDVVVAASTNVTAGDLVEVIGIAAGPTLTSARIVAIDHPLAFGRPRSDWTRFAERHVGAHLAARQRAIAAIRGYFAAERFLEVDTPAVVPSPGLDVHLVALAADGGYLVTSPEYQMKRLLVGGVPRCFQLARAFRGDEEGRLHNPEFSLLEWYRAFADYEDVMADTEAIVRAVAIALRGRAELARGDRVVDCSKPFARITVAEAFARFADVDEAAMLALASTDETRFFELLVDRVEPALEAYEVPVFLLDYPTPQASLARRKKTNPKVAERFELYAAGVELCNGFGELTDAIEQETRFHADQAERARRGLAVYPIDERFLDGLRAGMPRAAGNALGVDRLVALALGHDAIDRVQAFSRSDLGL